MLCDPLRMARIIFAWNYIEWGGVQTSTLPLIREARKRYEVLVVMPTNSSPELENLLRAEGAKIEYFGPPYDLRPANTIFAKMRRRFSIIMSERALLRHLFAESMDDTIVHVDLSPQKSFLTLLRLCLKTHVFVTVHNSSPRSNLMREILRTIKLRILARMKRFHVFCANNDAGEYLRGYLSKDTKKKITLVRDAVDLLLINSILETGYDRFQSVTSAGLRADKRLILTVGQFIDRKGRWAYLEAISKICQRRDDLQFVWVMPELPNVADLKRVKTFELGENFRMVLSENLGSSRRDILSFFRVADLFVLPSLVEGVPLALIEAMALGLPCVSTNVHGIPEAIESGRTGLLVEGGDVDALVHAIETTIDDRELSKPLARRGQDFVMANFDEQRSAQIALSEYDRCFV